MEWLSSGSNVTRANNSIDKWSFRDHGSTTQHLSPGELRVLLPAVLGVLCALGLACNLTAMGILVNNAHKGKLSLVNSLIFNLMLADGLVLAFAAPFRAASYSRPGWTLGWEVCKTADWFLQSCMAAKSFTVAAMAKACYRYVSNPTKQVSVRLGSILVVLLFTWLSACCINIPQWMFATLQRGSDGLECVTAVPPEARDFMAVYVKAYPLGVFCAPLSLALLYFWKAYGHCQRRSSKTQNLRTQMRSRKLTLMVFSLTVAMAILWLPQWVVWLWESHSAAAAATGVVSDGEGTQTLVSSPPLLLSLSAQLLTFSLSLVNPLIILSLSEEFKEGYRGLWRRLTLRKQPPPKPKPGPHNPTAPHSPCPRPETSGQPRRGRGFSVSVAQGPRRDAPTKPEQEGGEGGGGGGGGGGGEPDGLSLKDGVVLPDVEQFWHERETGSNVDENDPVPWEHQEHKDRN